MIHGAAMDVHISDDNAGDGEEEMDDRRCRQCIIHTFSPRKTLHVHRSRSSATLIVFEEKVDIRASSLETGIEKSSYQPLRKDFANKHMDLSIAGFAVIF